MVIKNKIIVQNEKSEAVINKTIIIEHSDKKSANGERQIELQVGIVEGESERSEERAWDNFGNLKNSAGTNEIKEIKQKSINSFSKKKDSELLESKE